LIYDLENPLINAQLRIEYLCQVSLKSVHLVHRYRVTRNRC